MKTQKNESRFFGTNTNRNTMKKCAILFSACLFQAGAMFGQTQTYDTFESSKTLDYNTKTGGTLNALAANPGSSEVNDSKKCAKYVRSGKQKYDNIKINLNGKLTDVNKYATYTGIPPTISMKVYTTAAVGTLVEMQLGELGDKYPAGINSQYQAYTTVTNAWEELNFKFSEIPKGSETSTTQVEQITLLFNPNSSTKDTYYFDDITGPALISEKSDLIAAPAKNDKTATK